LHWAVAFVLASGGFFLRTGGFGLGNTAFSTSSTSVSTSSAAVFFLQGLVGSPKSHPCKPMEIKKKTEAQDTARFIFITGNSQGS
jgi:hypothetical protein